MIPACTVFAAHGMRWSEHLLKQIQVSVMSWMSNGSSKKAVALIGTLGALPPPLSLCMTNSLLLMLETVELSYAGKEWLFHSARYQFLSFLWPFCIALQLKSRHEHLGLADRLDCELFSCAHEVFKTYWTWELCVKSLKERWSHGCGLSLREFSTKKSLVQHLSEPILQVGETPWTSSYHPKTLRKRQDLK